MEQNGSVVLKRFIRYLYEYEQGTRMRNVGFVKVEQDKEESVVHIHAKGLLSGSGKEFVFYLFYMQDGQCIGIYLGRSVCSGPVLNELWKYTKSAEDFAENYDMINGVIIENAQGHRYASVWNDTPVDISQMRVIEKKKEKKEERDEVQEGEIESEAEPQREHEVRNNTEGIMEMPSESLTEAVSEDAEENVPAIKSEEFPGMKIDKSPKKQSFRVRKIQRMEISKLARCEWKLANNNFLIHGYYNYHHLVFLENDSQFLLGVPGIYHEKEARAAEIFGFPKFISFDELDITLDSEEKNEEEVFGYWCRPVRQSLRW